jgi:hypothetical protein
MRWSMLAWILVGLTEVFLSAGLVDRMVLVGLFAAWAGLGTVLSWALPSPFLPCAICFFGSALIALAPSGALLNLSFLGVAAAGVGAIFLGRKLPLIGVLLAVPATLGGVSIRGAFPEQRVQLKRPLKDGPLVLLLTIDTLRADRKLATYQKLAERGLSGSVWSGGLGLYQD